MNRPKRMKLWAPVLLSLAVLTTGLGAWAASAAFDSGSSCVDPNNAKCLGAFLPTVTNTVIELPPDGILDYTTFTVPYGMNVFFKKNAANTPVLIRTTGNVTIEGAIYLNGTAATPSGTAGDGNLGDDGQPGVGGPGGFDGGYGGYATIFGGSSGKPGGSGNGPGGGATGGSSLISSGYGASGGGGGFGAAGGAGVYGGAGGSIYGQETLLPMVGGSGGGGGSAGPSFNGSGGGGGGGAITIASSTSIIMGKSGIGGGLIQADGGMGGASASTGSGGGGGSGSGGAIRLVADTLTLVHNSSRLYARGAGGASAWNWNSGSGGAGRIRLESNTITGWSANYSDPAYIVGRPGHVQVPNNPTLAITGVTPSGGSQVAVPANPTGKADITVATGTTSATVNIAASNIPRGVTVTVYVTPSSGAARSSTLSLALDGSSDAATTTTATIALSPGNNVIMAAATYTVSEVVAMNLPSFDGEQVAKIRVEATMGGEAQVVYITASGKEYLAGAAANSGLQAKEKV